MTTKKLTAVAMGLATGLGLGPITAIAQDAAPVAEFPAADSSQTAEPAPAAGADADAGSVTTTNTPPTDLQPGDMPDTYLAAPGPEAAPDAAVDATKIDEAPAGVTPATTTAPVAGATTADMKVIAVPQAPPHQPHAKQDPETHS